MTTEWVRVRNHATGHEYTVSRAEATMLAKELELLSEKEATDVNGRPLPPKPRRHFSDNNSEGEGLKPLPAPTTPKTPAKPATTEGK